MWVEDGVVVEVGLESERKVKGDAKTCFSAGHEVCVHYFKDICQGALQSDCEMFFSGERVPCAGSAIIIIIIIIIILAH